MSSSAPPPPSPPSGPRSVTAPDCLIPLERIGEIRSNPVGGGGGGGEEVGMKSSGTGRISQCAGDLQRKRSLQSIVSVGVQQVRRIFSSCSFQPPPPPSPPASPPPAPPTAAKMARDMSDKEILKMELDQLKKEVSTPRSSVSHRSSPISSAFKIDRGKYRKYRDKYQ